MRFVADGFGAIEVAGGVVVFAVVVAAAGLADDDDDVVVGGVVVVVGAVGAAAAEGVVVVVAGGGLMECDGVVAAGGGAGGVGAAVGVAVEPAELMPLLLFEDLLQKLVIDWWCCLAQRARSTQNSTGRALELDSDCYLSGFLRLLLPVIVVSACWALWVRPVGPHQPAAALAAPGNR